MTKPRRTLEELDATADSVEPLWSTGDLVLYTGQSDYMVRLLVTEGVFVPRYPNKQMRFTPVEVVAAWKEHRG